MKMKFAPTQICTIRHPCPRPVPSDDAVFHLGKLLGISLPMYIESLTKCLTDLKKKVSRKDFFFFPKNKLRTVHFVLFSVVKESLPC